MFEKQSEIMNNRGGFPVKNVLYAMSAIVFLYVMYLYNGSQNLLHETEMSVARYRREASDRVNEIQELIKSKDQMQESCKDERHESATRFNSLKQQHAMLQSQFKETEADFLKLKTDMDTMKGDYQQSESQHATEYQQFKQQKEMEISDLKDQLANSNTHNEDLSKSIASLQQQVQSLQMTPTNASSKANQQQLQQNNLQLQQQLQSASQTLQQQQQQHQQQQQQQQQQQAVVQQQGFASNQGLIQNMKIQDPKINQGSDNLNLQLGQNNLNSAQVVPRLNPGLPNDGNNDALAQEIEKAVPRIDEANAAHLNAQHQVLPPSNEEVKDNPVTAGAQPVELGENVKPNDQNMAQIQEPNLGDKNDGGEAGVARVDTGGVEEQRAEQAQEEEEGALDKDGALNKPLNPLALGQMEEPIVDDKQEDDLNEDNKDNDIDDIKK